MAQSRALKDALDDAMVPMKIYFQGPEGEPCGLDSETDPQDLPLWRSPDCQNVKFLKPGKIIGRAGYVARTTSMAAVADGIAFFYDNSGARRLAVWVNGTLYDDTTYTLSSVDAGSYTAGNRIAWTTLNNILYWSDGVTALRFWNPALGTSGAVPNAGGGGVIPPPAASVLTTYAGAIVAGNTYVSATQEPSAIRWCNVNDPTTWVGTNIQQVGQGQGGSINCVVPFGISNVGISPFKALFVGKSKDGVYGLSGALGTLTEFIINAPTGVLDGATAKYIPGPDGSGFVTWLGTDNKVWYSNGSTAGELSTPIRSEVSQYITDRLSISMTAKFTAVRNFEDFQYVLDLGGNRQYAYDYDRKVWTRYDGWSSGYWCEAKGPNGEHVIYCADQTTARIIQANIGLTDGGDDIDPYYKTGYLNANSDSDIWKIWKWIYMEFQTNTGSVDIEARVNLGQGDTATATISIPVTPGAQDALWDLAVWDVDVWVAGGAATYTPYKGKARLKTEQATGNTSPGSLSGYDLQLTFSNGTPSTRFEVLGAEVLYLPRGRARVAVAS